MARPFIWERMSRSCSVGRVPIVLEMASGHVRPGGSSVPGGKTGRVVEDEGGWP